MEHLSEFILNHWQLWLSLMLILLLICANELLAQKKKAKHLSPQAAVDLINNADAWVIDLRDKLSFQKGHIIHSINAKSEDFTQQKMDKYKNKPIILVCARGLESSALASKITTQGYQALVLSGGIAAWQNAALPLVKGRS